MKLEYLYKRKALKQKLKMKRKNKTKNNISMKNDYDWVDYDQMNSRIKIQMHTIPLRRPLPCTQNE